MLWLCERDVRRLIDRDALIAAVADAFRDLARGAVVNPPQTRIDDVARRSNFVAFPSYIADRGIYAVKVLGASERNPGDGLPFIHAVNVLVDAEHARPVAIIDAGFLTGCRTAATSAVALQMLRPGRGGTLGLLGTGLQARAHLEFLPRVRQFARILVCSPSGVRARAETLAAQAGAPVEAASSVADVLAQSDVVLTATHAGTPLFAAEAVRPECCVLVVGKFRPGATEVPPGLVARAGTVVVDQPARFLSHWQERDGDGLPADALARIRSLGDILVAGTAPAAGLSVFFSEGMAMEDAVASQLIYDRAVAAGLGARLE